MIIRDAIPSDASDIADLTVQLGYPTAEDLIQKRILRISTAADHLLLVASTNDNVGGWIQASVCDTLESGRRVEIIGLVVSADCRRTGIGRALVQAAEEWAADTGASTIIVRSNVSRSESHSFYPVVGYMKSKTQHLYKKSLAESAEQGAQPDAFGAG